MAGFELDPVLWAESHRLRKKEQQAEQIRATWPEGMAPMSALPYGHAGYRWPGDPEHDPNALVCIACGAIAPATDADHKPPCTAEESPCSDTA